MICSTIAASSCYRGSCQRYGRSCSPGSLHCPGCWQTPPALRENFLCTRFIHPSSKLHLSCQSMWGLHTSTRLRDERRDIFVTRHRARARGSLRMLINHLLEHLVHAGLRDVRSLHNGEKSIMTSCLDNSALAWPVGVEFQFVLGSRRQQYHMIQMICMALEFS